MSWCLIVLYVGTLVDLSLSLILIFSLNLFVRTCQLCFTVSEFVGSEDLDDLAQLETLVFNGKYGSLLNLGKLIFSSKNKELAPIIRPEIEKLVQYMNTTFRTFDRSVHD